MQVALLFSKSSRCTGTFETPFSIHCWGPGAVRGASTSSQVPIVTPAGSYCLWLLSFATNTLTSPVPGRIRVFATNRPSHTCPGGAASTTPAEVTAHQSFKLRRIWVFLATMTRALSACSNSGTSLPGNCNILALRSTRVPLSARQSRTKMHCSSVSAI